MRDKELRNSFTNLLSGMCCFLEIEPHLQSLPRELFANKPTINDDAVLDIKANGLWKSRFSNKTNFDVKIFNTLAEFCPGSSMEVHKYHETIKKTIISKKCLIIIRKNIG